MKKGLKMHTKILRKLLNIWKILCFDSSEIKEDEVIIIDEKKWEEGVSIVEVDYSIVLKNLSDMLDFSGVLALSKVQNISVSDVIKKGILTNIAQETLPNYKNYEYIISGITQARMMKGVHSDRNYVPSQIENY